MGTIEALQLFVCRHEGEMDKSKKAAFERLFYFYPVGAEGFEPPTLCL